MVKLCCTLICVAFLVLLGCENNSVDRLQEKQQILSVVTGLIAAQPNCTANPTPAFSTLAQAGTTSRCATCHSGGSPSSGFDITNYSQVRGVTLPGDPRGSFLYQKATSGTMAPNSTITINNAIYCWILGGSHS